MGRIAAGTDFGQAVARPTRFNETATPRAAFGVADTAIQMGRELEAQALQDERRAQIEREQAAREAQAERVAADRTQATARAGVLADRLGDLVGEIDAGLQEGRVPKTEAGKTWKERSAQIIEDGLLEVPEQFRGAVRITAQARAESLTSRVGDAVRRKDRSDTLANINQTLEHAQRQAMTDPAGARAVVESALALGPQAGLDANQIQKARQQWVEGTAYTRAFSAVQAARADNKALATVEKAIDKDGDLDPQRKAQLLANIEGYRGQNEARALRQAHAAELAAQRRQRESDAAWNTLSAWVLAGKLPNPEAKAGLIAKLTPDAGLAYRTLAATIPQRTAAAMQPLAAQQAQLDALVAKRNKDGTSAALEAEIDRREKVLVAARKDYAAEPLRAGAERGLIDSVAPLDLRSLDTAATGLAARVAQAQTVQGVTGKPVSPLTGDEAQAVAQLLEVLPVKERALRIAQVGSVMPREQALALADQLDPKNRALALQFVYGAAPTPDRRLVSELIGMGAAAKKDGTSTKLEKQPDVKASLWRARATADLDGAFIKPEVAAQVRDAAELIMHGLAAEQGGRLVASDMTRAVEMAVGGKVVEHNGRKIPLPAGMDLGDFEDRLERVTVLDIGAPDGNVIMAGRVTPVAEFVKLLPGMPLAAVTPGRYAVVGGGRPVLNTRGDAITIGVR